MKVAAALLFLAAVGDPCCNTCANGKAKFYSIPEPQDKDAECGECCLDPSKYKLWKLFEPKLLKGDCASQGYTTYLKTETDGVWPLQVKNDRYVRGDDATFCPSKMDAVFADMHDGDKKEVSIDGTSLTIKPSGNNQTWVVKTVLDATSCSANIDFNVPGKPSPPPINLTATLWFSIPALGSEPTDAAKKAELEFTDPSAKVPAPLNRWVALSWYSVSRSDVCPESLDFVYADMHDGDKKHVVVSSGSMTITPSGNSEKWEVKTTLDAKTCSAVVDFNVPGKPGPPPVNLTATLIGSITGLASGVQQKTLFEFTDPSGTLAPKDFPLNTWVQVGSAREILGAPVLY